MAGNSSTLVSAADPVYLRRDELEALCAVAASCVDVIDEAQEAALRSIRTRYPHMICLHEPTQVEARAGILVRALATARGRELCHAYRVGFSAAEIDD